MSKVFSPVSDEQIEVISNRCAGKVEHSYSDHERTLLDCRTLIRAIAERDATIKRITNERDIAARLAGHAGPALHYKIEECDEWMRKATEQQVTIEQHRETINALRSEVREYEKQLAAVTTERDAIKRTREQEQQWTEVLHDLQVAQEQVASFTAALDSVRKERAEVEAIRARRDAGFGLMDEDQLWSDFDGLLSHITDLERQQAAWLNARDVWQAEMAARDERITGLKAWCTEAWHLFGYLPEMYPDCMSKADELKLAEMREGCPIDFAPRVWTDAQVKRLNTVAEQLSGKMVEGKQSLDIPDFLREKPKVECEKCSGSGWLRGRELENPSEDTYADTMTKYACDGDAHKQKSEQQP